jgi:hypothetical protein
MLGTHGENAHDPKYLRKGRADWGERLRLRYRECYHGKKGGVR